MKAITGMTTSTATVASRATVARLRTSTCVLTCVLTCAVTCVLTGTNALAQMTDPQSSIPSAQQMEEQLKAVPRTRSLMRNLAVTATPATPAASGGAATPAAPTNSTAQPAAPEPAQRPSLDLAIQFDFDSARIRPQSVPVLLNLATALNSQSLSHSRFSVEGHTDAKGDPQYNRRLSEQRALAVRDLLTSHGVRSEQLVPIGMGSDQLANPAEPLSPQNRRVRVVNLD